jgi:hypothetical protein
MTKFTGFLCANRNGNRASAGIGRIIIGSRLRGNLETRMMAKFKSGGTG